MRFHIFVDDNLIDEALSDKLKDLSVDNDPNVMDLLSEGSKMEELTDKEPESWYLTCVD